MKTKCKLIHCSEIETVLRITLFAHSPLVSFRSRASSRCFCSTRNLAFVALSISFILRKKKRTRHKLHFHPYNNKKNLLTYFSPAVTSFHTLRDSHSDCSQTGRTCFLKIGMLFTSTNVSSLEGLLPSLNLYSIRPLHSPVIDRKDFLSLGE